MQLRIGRTWDGLPVSRDPVTIALKSYDAGLLMQISAPFFNGPPALLGAPEKAFRKLWDYEELPLEFDVTRTETKWKGRAHLPWHYFPPDINKFNAFAIRGSGEHRKYEALYPVPRHKLQEGQTPDFHRLGFFQESNLKELVGEDWKQPESGIWKSHTK